MDKPSGRQVPVLDLHGYRVAEVADAVDRFLVSSMKRGAKRVRVMTGKGLGQVRKATIEYLKLGGFPYEMERLPGGAANEGVLIVFLDD